MRISRAHNLSADEARSRINEVASSLERQFSLRSEWRGDQLMFTGRGVNGQIDISDEHIELNLKLGFALMIMEGSIRSAIEDVLDKEIG